VDDYRDAWQGPFTVNWYTGLNGDGPHTVSGEVYDIFGHALATCPTITFTVRVEGMSNQSINAFPTSGKGKFGMLLFDDPPTYDPGNMFIDGFPTGSGTPLYNVCGAAGASGQTGGWQIPNLVTTCWPNGQHLIMASYGIINISDPYLLNSTVSSVSGNNLIFTAPHFGVNNGVVTFSTSGTLPAPIVPGSQWYWKTSTTNSANTVTVSISGGVMTFTMSSAVPSGTPIYVRNIQFTNQTTGQADCDGYFASTTFVSSNSVSVPVPAVCNGASGSLDLEVDVNPYFVQYVNGTTISVSATPGGSTLTLTSGGSGTHTATFRIRSPYWTGNPNSGGNNISASDYASTGGPANVYQLVTFSNGTKPMELRPPDWEYHGWTGKTGDTVCAVIENTDLTQTTPSCGSPQTYTVVPDGYATGVITVNSSTGAITYTSTPGWAQVQIACLTCGYGGIPIPTVTVYVQNHGGSSSAAITFPNFTTCGLIATAFQTGSCHSFYPLGMWQLDVSYATTYRNNPMPWIGSMMQQAHLNSAMSSFSPGAGPGTTPQSVCPDWSSGTTQMGYTESFASTYGISLEFDMSTVWFQGNGVSAPITALAAILGNTQYNRQACVQSLVSHHVGTGVYWRYEHDDEFTDELGSVLQPGPIIGGGSWTNAVASSGTITFNFSAISTLLAWSQSTGQGAWVQIVDAANTCMNGWYPINTVTNTGSYTTAATSTTTCSNGTYAPSGGTVTESTAQIVLNPSGLYGNNNSQQNCGPLPSQPGASQQAWAATYLGGCGGAALSNSTYNAASSALTSIVVSGSTATIHYTGHSLPSTNTPAIRISGAATANLNILAPATYVDANTLTIAYPGTTGQAAPSAGTYNSTTDPSLFITVDPNWGPNPLGQFYALVNGVSNHPAISWSILGGFFSPTSIPTMQSYEYNPGTSFDYIAQGPAAIYGPDTSVWLMANYSQSGSGLLTRAYQAKPRSMLWTGGFVSGGAMVQYCRSFNFNPACDKPGELIWRPETLVAQMMGMKTLDIAGLRGYNFTQNMSDVYRLTCCGWQGGGTGTGVSMNRENNPKQWAAMARVNALLTLREDTELQPEANKPYLGPMFSTDAHTSATYGNELTILCESEVPYGSFSQNLPIISGGSMLKYILTGYSLTVTQLSGNPSTDTDEFCSSPGRTTVYVAQPAGVNVLNNITFAPPAPLPFSASKFLVQVGYYPNAMQDDPVTDCTAVCTIAVDHHNTAAWYRVIYADSNNLPRSIGDPVQIASQNIQ
jgi:hypothetical protein